MIRVSVMAAMLGAATAAHAEASVTIAQTIPYANDSVGSQEVRTECDWNSQLSTMIVAQSGGTIVSTDKDLSQVQGRVLALTITEVHTAGGGRWSGKKWATVHGELRDGTTVLGNFETTGHTVGGTITGCGTLLYIDNALASQIVGWARQGDTATLATQIDSDDPGAVRQAANDLYRRSSLDRATLDAVATRIEKGRSNNDAHMSDALSWLCKVLQKSGDGRYKPFLLAIADSAADAKLRKYAAAAAKSLPDGSADAYVPPSAPEPAAPQAPAG